MTLPTKPFEMGKPGKKVSARGQGLKRRNNVSVDANQTQPPTVNQKRRRTNKDDTRTANENETILYQREPPTVDIGNQGNAEEANNDSVEFGVLGGMEVVNEPISFVSVFDSIGYHIPQKLKEQIWEGRFIDLSLLLKSARELNMADESAGDLIIKGGKLAVERKVQQKSIYNINLWTSAFIIFTSIMIEKHPGKAQELLKYLRDIRLAAYRPPQLWHGCSTMNNSD